MENAIMIREEITEAKIIEYLDSAGKTKGLLDNEKRMFINMAREYGLNPFKREIYINAYGQGDNRKCSIITGYEVYIKRAERTGKLDGWNIKYEGEGDALKAVVEIYRRDWKYPFKHEVYFIECVQLNKEGRPNAVWAKMPRFMTKKVAIGQAFRLCFSDDLGGMPYEEAEMPQEERNVTEIPENEINHEPMNNYVPKDTQKVTVLENELKDQKSLLNAMKTILLKVNPDQLPYFSDKEIEMERAIVKGAENFQSLKNQYERLKNELVKREEEYDPIPFESKGPLMYTEQESETIEFEDDKPWNANNGEKNIY